MTAISQILPLNALPPAGTVQADESVEEPGLVILQHVHSPVGPNSLDPTKPSMMRHTMHKVISGGESDLLRRIPVRVHFDKPEHNIRARYEAWLSSHESGPVCVGNGEKAALLNPVDGTKSQRVCKGPEHCPLVKNHGFDCRFKAYMDVLIEGKPFEVRTQSVNSYVAMLTGMSAASQIYGPLSKQMFDLVAWLKSTRGSEYTPFTSIAVEHTTIVEEVEPIDQTAQQRSAWGQQILNNWNAAFTVDPGDAVAPSNELPFRLQSMQNHERKQGTSTPDPLEHLISSQKSTMGNV